MSSSAEFHEWVENFALLYLNPNGVRCTKAIGKCSCLDLVCQDAIRLSIGRDVNKWERTSRFSGIVYSRRSDHNTSQEDDKCQCSKDFYDCKKESIDQGLIKIDPEFEKMVEQGADVKQTISKICFLINYVRQKRYEDEILTNQYEDDIQLILWMLNPTIVNNFFEEYVKKIRNGDAETVNKYLGLVSCYLEGITVLHTILNGKDHDEQLTPIDFIQPDEQTKNSNVIKMLQAGFAFLGQHEIANESLYIGYMQPESVCVILKESVENLYIHASTLNEALGCLCADDAKDIELVGKIRDHINSIMESTERYADPLVGCDRR